MEIHLLIYQLHQYQLLNFCQIDTITPKFEQLPFSIIIPLKRMSSGKHYHFRSGQKIPKTSFGIPRRSADRDDVAPPLRFTADSQYFNRRVHTQTNDNDDFEVGKAMQRLGLGSYKNTEKVMSILRKNEKEFNKYESAYAQLKQKRNDGLTIQVPKAGMMITANNLHQNISIFTESKPKKEVNRFLATETGENVFSKDKTTKKDNKRLFERLLLAKDKSLKSEINKSNKSKQPREKFVSGNLRQKPFFANDENDHVVEKVNFREGNYSKGRDSNKQRLVFRDIQKNTMKEVKTLKTEPCQLIVKPEIQMLEKIGEGTFGQVYKARLGNKTVAVKKVFQDKKYKNRELEILSMIKNDFVLNVIDTFYTQQKSKKGEPPKDYLNVVMQYYQQNLFEANSASEQALSEIELKLFMYQLFRGLMYIHSLDICHRDIKPQNILVSRKNAKLVICDFGSAKKLVKGEANIAYICSRCYRAPELIFGCTSYTPMIDIWSAGCVLLELLTREPFFIGDSNIGQLVQIIKTLGTPSKTQVMNMNPSYDLDDYKFPKIKTKPWRQIFPKIDTDLESLLKQLMIYSPKERLNAAEALAHEYFDELREESTYNYLRQKKQIRALFDFTKEQLRNNEHLAPRLVPDWYRNQLFDGF